MKFENTAVMNFQNAIRGMRNPMNSWDKSDSECLYHIHPNFSIDDKNASKYDKWNKEFDGFNFKFGNSDLTLAQKLICAGSEHRKFMRQIFVCVDITAPMYWWKEFDTYKVATVRNSCSTMHKIHSKPFSIDDFEHDGVDDVDLNIQNAPFTSFDVIVPYLENLRILFNETKDKRYWRALIQSLPDSYLMKSTVTLNYETLLGICSKGQRRFHKLNEWSGQDNPNLPNFISWARTLPYAQELIFIDEVIGNE